LMTLNYYNEVPVESNGAAKSWGFPFAKA